MVLRVTLSFLLLSIFPTALIALCLPRYRKSLWLWLPAFILTAASLFLLLGAGYVSYKPSLWRVRLFSAIFFLAVPELGLVLFLLFACLFKGRTRRWIQYIGAMFALLLSVSLFYGFTQGTSRIVRKSMVVAEERIPRAFDDYRIAVLSDLHVGTYHGDTASISRKVQAVNATDADLICFVGDLVNFSDEELQEFLPQLSRLQAKDGVVSVMGNHDNLMYHPHPDSIDVRRRIQNIQDMQRQIGWHLLLNDRIVIRRGSDSLVIAGVENDSRPPLPQRADVDKALKGIGTNAYCIMLTHDPTLWRRAIVGRTSVPLAFAGHTHGLQFSLPGGWSPVACVFPEWNGRYTEGLQTLYVTTGIGEALAPFRLGAWPEVVVCTLRHVDR